MVSDRWQKEEMALKHMQAELQQQQAVLAKEVRDLKETLEVRNMAWAKGAGKPQECDSCLIMLR